MNCTTFKEITKAFSKYRISYETLLQELSDKGKISLLTKFDDIKELITNDCRYIELTKANPLVYSPEELFKKFTKPLFEQYKKERKAIEANMKKANLNISQDLSFESFYQIIVETIGKDNITEHIKIEQNNPSSETINKESNKKQISLDSIKYYFDEAIKEHIREIENKKERQYKLCKDFYRLLCRKMKHFSTNLYFHKH